eukprot:COSAG05_NODE_546_length_8763_cov_12.991228_7_plen_525_part_00
MGKRKLEELEEPLLAEKQAKKLAKKAKKEKKAKKAKKETVPEENQPHQPAASVDDDAAEAKRLKKLKKAAKRAKKAKKAKDAAAGGAGAGAGAVPKVDATEPATPKAGGVGDLPPPITSFSMAPFADNVKAALSKAFAEPTPIQAQSWPIALAGADLIAVAKTGSGKTLGFLLPAFHKHGGSGAGSKGPRVLVIAPTRELAVQINAECDKFGPLFNCNSTCVYGGAPIGQQQSILRQEQPTVIVATPGRLCDLMGRSCISLAQADIVVLDEADRMLDMGFEPQIKQVFEALPAVRQTLFFTATWPKSVRKLAQNFLRSADSGNLKQVFIGTSADAELEANTAVSQTFIQARDDVKDEKLWELLENLKEGSRVVCFANTKRRVDVCQKNFKDFGSVAIHGDKRQDERDKALAQFVKGDYPLMFATDVAARGLDIKGVTHVINFDMARDVESYVHRIGRTGRAGELGDAITFWNPDYDKECTPALCKIARNAGQEVPDWLEKFEKTKATKNWKVEKAEVALKSLSS